MKGSVLFAKLAKEPAFTRVDPKMAEFFKDYLSKEKVVCFDGQYVINTNFPPYPSRAFEGMLGLLAGAEAKRLYSVALAVTNRCNYNCWHCYNAGRSQIDTPLETMRQLASDIQDMGASTVTLTGGEPMLREDLEDIAGYFDDRTSLTVSTTGAGLTADRAKALKDCGVFAVGISLDSVDPQEHDRLRGIPGAFETACEAIRIAREAGLYPYVAAMATREFLAPERFTPFMQLVARTGALEVHLLEPSATGKLAGRTDVLLRPNEQQLILDYQQQVAADEELPILSSFSYMESSEVFGCGAGLTHLYIDGSGEVCPCNLVPLSFGNITQETLAEILEKLGRHFRRARTTCVAKLLAGKVPGDQFPAPFEVADEVCRKCLPQSHEVPRFIKIAGDASRQVGQTELQTAYDSVHGDYDEFWLAQAAEPIDQLVEKLPWRGDETVFDAGCGTGYGTAMLAQRAAEVVAADISEGMLAEARKRIEAGGLDNVRLVLGDALEIARTAGPFDVVFSSWVLGYIAPAPFFSAARAALKQGGRLALVVHKENSPREPLEIFAELVAEDPSIMLKRVAFDFPRDIEQVRAQLQAAGLAEDELWQGEVVFRYDSPEGVLEHLLKSGAGTAFHDAIDPDRRDGLTRDFLHALAARHPSADEYLVTHEYVACIAHKP